MSDPNIGMEANIGAGEPQELTGGKRYRKHGTRKHGTRKGMVRKTARRAYMKSKKRGGSFLSRFLVPGTLLVGQRALVSRRKHGTRKGKVRRTARRAYMKSK